MTPLHGEVLGLEEVRLPFFSCLVILVCKAQVSVVLVPLVVAGIELSGPRPHCVYVTGGCNVKMVTEYKIVSESNEGIEHSPSSSQNDYIYLVFYNSTSVYPSTDERTEFYGSYYIYSDGLLQFSGSPYHSAVFSYKLKNNIFDDVLKKTFS